MKTLTTKVRADRVCSALNSKQRSASLPRMNLSHVVNEYNTGTTNVCAAVERIDEDADGDGGDKETRLPNRRPSQFYLNLSFFLALSLSHCFARHLSSKSLSAQLLTGLFSLRLTSLCRSHTQTLNASRDSTLGGFALISFLKSF